MAEAVEEMSHYTDGDYLVVNDIFDQALQELQAIVTSQRLRTPRQQQALGEMLGDMLS
jgi:guanylate kinase